MIDRRALLRGVGLAGVAGLVSGACGSSAVSTLRLSAGEQGGLFFEFANLLADATRSSGTRLTALQSDGSVDNLRAAASGQAELAMTLLDLAEDEAHRAGLLAIGRVYENYFQIAVPASSPVRSIIDLRGGTVSVGAPGSGAALMSSRILAAAGLTDAVRTSHLTMHDAATALGTGGIDAAMWAGGLPTPVFARAVDGIRLLDLREVGERMRLVHGATYEPVRIPEGAYGGQASIVTVGVMNLLLARADVDDGAIGSIVDVLIDESAALVPPQAIGSQFLDAQSLILTGSVPLHPGAAERYRSRHG